MIPALFEPQSETCFGITLSGALVLDGNPDSWASFSVDRDYRYALCRRWNEEAPWFVAVGLNPSTADASKDDPTVRRLIGFARREKCGTLLLVNVFARRATDPRDLLTAPDPVGPRNDEVITIAARMPMMALVVAAWGSAPGFRLRKRVGEVRIFPRRGRWKCFGRTKSGDPRHPLYLPKTTPIIELEK